MAAAKGEALAVAAPCDLLPLSGQRCGCAQMHRGLRERRRRFGEVLQLNPSTDAKLVNRVLARRTCSIYHPKSMLHQTHKAALRQLSEICDRKS
jgi:hypothetical protein